jgi:hypothetical protein
VGGFLALLPERSSALLPTSYFRWGGSLVFGGFSVWGKLLGVKERDGNFVVPLD